ncbi:hypothetical protein MBLNU459_g3172t1 [Dothideomycetes sp. NU459]
MASPTTALMQSLRNYAPMRRGAVSTKDRLKFVAAMGYCCIAFSAPFAGAAEMSRRTGKDGSFEKMRPLSLRDCSAYGSRLEDYSGAWRIKS